MTGRCCSIVIFDHRWGEEVKLHILVCRLGMSDILLEAWWLAGAVCNEASDRNVWWHANLTFQHICLLALLAKSKFQELGQIFAWTAWHEPSGWKYVWNATSCCVGMGQRHVQSGDWWKVSPSGFWKVENMQHLFCSKQLTFRRPDFWVAMSLSQPALGRVKGARRPQQLWTMLTQFF